MNITTITILSKLGSLFLLVMLLFYYIHHTVPYTKKTPKLSYSKKQTSLIEVPLNTSKKG